MSVELISIIQAVIILVLAFSIWYFWMKLSPIARELKATQGKLDDCESQLHEITKQNKEKDEEIRTLKHQMEVLDKILQEAAEKIADYEKSSSTIKGDGLLEKVVQKVVGFGIPGLVLLVMIATSGFYGAAAITTTLAALGGPGGMIAGVGVLIAMGLTADALAKYGLPRIAESVIKGLINKGDSIVKIREQIKKYPSSVISQKLKERLLKMLDDYEEGSLT